MLHCFGLFRMAYLIQAGILEYFQSSQPRPRHPRQNFPDLQSIPHFDLQAGKALPIGNVPPHKGLHLLISQS